MLKFKLNDFNCSIAIMIDRILELNSNMGDNKLYLNSVPDV